MIHLIFIRRGLALGLLSALLSGCAEIHQGVETVSRVGSPALSVSETEAVPVSIPGIETVRPQGAPRVLEQAGGTAVEASAVPTPREIFDFHPAGSTPGSFRQPFIIDPNEGPLTADVRRTAAELKTFNALMRSGITVANSKRCSEMDAAHNKSGCVGQKPKVVSSVSRDPPMLQ